MMRRLAVSVVLLLGAVPAAAQQRQQLRTGWLIQSSARAGTDGATISAPGYQPQGWLPATVPSTVVGAQVDAGVFKDPFFGMNLRDLPGMTYPIGDNFVHRPMDPSSPYAVPWWYRTTFHVPAGGTRFVLRFDGINYRANIWLNGRRLADSSQVAGTYRRYDLDVTDVVRRTGPNALAVEVWAPTPPDLQTTWVDWNPSPPDKDMGLWKPVYLVSTGDVAIRHPFVTSRVDTVTLRSAELTVATQLRNLAAHPVTGTLRGRIGGVAFSRRITLPANDSALVEFTPAQVARLRFVNPRLWWPAQMGRPELYTLNLTFDVNGRVSDEATTPFGIRQVTSQLIGTAPRQAYLFRVNGRRILIRGGGWAPDMFFRPEPQRQDAQLKYALDMHLNAIRLEGNYEDDRFFARTDSLGILVMTGWVCCNAWEEWKKWGPEQYAVSAASLRDQIRRLRSHPSVFVWLNGSDNPPPADVEKTYLAIEEQERWPNPTLSSAATRPAEFSGASGVKMTGPYDWVPPSYWLQDTTHGGAWSYNTETSPGAAMPPIESMRLMVPARDLTWPLDTVVLYHAAGGQFTHLLDRFNTALATRFGAPASLEEYTFKSQLMTYEGQRAMFEAYRRNKYGTTGLIQWMFNNAWPSIYWHLFDWYLRPAGGYFGTKKANEPVHAMYSYDDRSIVIVNAGASAVPRVRLRVRMLALDGSVKFDKVEALNVPADTSLRVLTLPQPEGVAGAYFLDLRLSGGAAGKPLSTNFYWLSTTPDVLADTSTWYVTPVKSYADYTALRSLAPERVGMSVRFTRMGETGEAHVTVSNPGKQVAFFLRLQVLKGAQGDEVLPVFWEDNYISLLPGETRTLTARYSYRDLGAARPVVAVSGWNVARLVAR